MSEVGRIILMHGKDKNSSDVWYPWVGEVAERYGWGFESPDLPKPETPVLSEWLAVLDKLKPTSEDILVGHSRGAVAILRYLEEYDVKVRSVVLVAGNSPLISDHHYDSFYEPGQYKFETIKPKAKRFVVLHSKDDNWVLYEAGKINAEGIEAKLVTVDGKRHFGKDSEGKLQMSIPELEEILIRETDNE